MLVVCWQWRGQVGSVGQRNLVSAWMFSHFPRQTPSITGPGSNPCSPASSLLAACCAPQHPWYWQL